MTLGIEREGLAEPLRELVGGGVPVLGTCAGMIMLDRRHLGLLDILAERNAFGRQLRSFEADLDFDGLFDAPVHAVFIRAPWVAEYGRQVRGSGQRRRPPGRGAPGQSPGRLVHPELTGETRLHELLLGLVND